MSKKRVRDDMEGKAVDPPNVLKLLPFFAQGHRDSLQRPSLPNKLPNVD
jgi:hypothetical protein